MASHILNTIDALFGERHTTISKDLKLNIRRLIDDSHLSAEESTLAVIALTKAVGFSELMGAAREQATQLGLSEDAIQEAEENAAIMGMLNTYYRFRHFIEENDPEAKDAYGAAKLRMTSLANPAMGKEKFEMLALAVSAINGCERCVSSHEKALMHIGVDREKIHDLGRLASVIKALSLLRI